jgi:hypothetical protein
VQLALSSTCNPKEWRPYNKIAYPQTSETTRVKTISYTGDLSHLWIAFAGGIIEAVNMSTGEFEPKSLKYFLLLYAYSLFEFHFFSLISIVIHS